MSNICFRCGKISHETTHCIEAPAPGRDGRFGPHLRADHQVGQFTPAVVTGRGSSNYGGMEDGQMSNEGRHPRMEVEEAVIENVQALTRVNERFITTSPNRPTNENLEEHNGEMHPEEGSKNGKGQVTAIANSGGGIGSINQVESYGPRANQAQSVMVLGCDTSAGKRPFNCSAQSSISAESHSGSDLQPRSSRKVEKLEIRRPKKRKIADGQEQRRRNKQKIHTNQAKHLAKATHGPPETGSNWLGKEMDGVKSFFAFGSAATATQSCREQ